MVYQVFSNTSGEQVQESCSAMSGYGYHTLSKVFSKIKYTIFFCHLIITFTVFEVLKNIRVAVLLLPVKP